MIPRACLPSGTGSRVLVEQRVEIVAEALEVDRRCARERRDCGVGGYEAALSQRRQLSDRHSASGDDERFSAVERPHDLAALVAQFSLSDLASHLAERSTCATQDLT